MERVIGGGYTTAAVRSRTKFHSREGEGARRHKLAVSQKLLDAVNKVQRVAWRVNPFVWQAFDHAWTTGARYAGLPAREKAESIRIDGSLFKALSKEDRDAQVLRVERAERAEDARVETSERLINLRAVLQEVHSFPQIFFPHHVDFRSRLYPIPQFFHPQSEDVVRGLLQFAEGIKLTEDGEFWQKVAIATAYANGIDKLPFDKRLAWTEKNWRELIACVVDPDGSELWKEASECWQLLALVHDLHQAKTSGYTYVPVTQDATCSGIQHLSALCGDTETALMVNLTSGDTIRDLYGELAVDFPDIISLSCVSGAHGAMHQGVNRALPWGYINDLKGDAQRAAVRTVVKRAVMTTPYGSTRRGRRGQMLTELPQGEWTNKQLGQAASWLEEVLSGVMAEKLTRVTALMESLQATVRLLGQYEHDFEWVTPLGCRVVQRYASEASACSHHSVWCDGRKLRINMEIPNADDYDVDYTKGATSVVPNLIHSLDSSLLCEIALRFDGAFNCIHDCVGTHAARVPELRRIAVDAFADQYSQPVLKSIYTELDRLHPEVGLVAPKVSTLDMEQVRGSQYMFS